MLITLNIDTALLSRQDYDDARHIVSYLESVHPSWVEKHCPVQALVAGEPVVVKLPEPTGLAALEGETVVEILPPAEAEKKRRGRKPKEEVPAPTSAAEPVEPAMTVETVFNPPTELVGLLKKLDDQMIEGEMPEDKRTAALDKWKARGEEGITDLKVAIEKNEEFLAKKRSAKAEATKTPTSDPEKFTLDVLRANLKMYSEKHGLEKGDELLKKFGCNRISEMENKTPAEQDEFMAICRGRVDA